jgi:Flp pilus assembly protein TadG
MPADRQARSDGGFVTVWILGLCVTLLFLGGISLDLWRAFSARRALAAVADAAAVAGASALDLTQHDAHGRLMLDPGQARQRALDSLAAQGESAFGEPEMTGEPRIDVTPERITVTVTGEVPYTLLKIFLADEPFEISVDATASPVRKF